MDAVIHMQDSPPHKQFLVLIGCSPPFMRLAQTPHGAARLVQATPTWSAKTRRSSVPALRRGTRDYGHRTTTMHGMSTPLTLPFFTLPCALFRAGKASATGGDGKRCIPPSASLRNHGAGSRLQAHGASDERKVIDSDDMMRG